MGSIRVLEGFMGLRGLRAGIFKGLEVLFGGLERVQEGKA